MAEETVRNLLTKIEKRELVLPEFQREFTWSKGQTRDLVDSILKRYPIGSLLFWKTDSVPALKNMPDFEPDGRVEVLLDGQQRLTALYMLAKDGIPPYYAPRDVENGNDPRGLHYNLETQEIGYYKKIEMENNPRWVPVVDCFQENGVDPGEIAETVCEEEETDRFSLFRRLSDNLQQLTNILEVKPPVMYVQEEADLRHALTVFDRVNSNGTPLTEADIAMAHMCSRWSETRRQFKAKLHEMTEQGFEFDLTFLTRAMNAVVNGRAEYRVLHGTTEEELIAGWNTLDRLLDYLINFLRDRAYVYTTDDLSTTNVLIPMLGYLAQHRTAFHEERARTRLLYWMYAALYQRRYSGSVDQKLERDLNALEQDRPIDALIAVLREDEGSHEVAPSHLDRRGVSHPLYNMTQILIRAHGGVDWSNGLKLNEPFGDSFSLQRHHIFPKAVLKEVGYDTGDSLNDRQRVHEIANRVPLTQEGNLDIFANPPSEYLPIVEEQNPGNLEKFMVPLDRDLWDTDHYEDFLKERRRLITTHINEYMKRLMEASERPVAPSAARPESTEELIEQGESETVEFKSTLRWHIYAERMDKDIEHASLKTIAAFLNSDGGTLLIGVNDDGEPIGLENDQFASSDKMMLHLTNIIKDRIGASYIRFLRMTVDEVTGMPVLRVDCRPGVVPAYLQHGNDEHFYIRTGPSTTRLQPSEIHEYVEHHFYGED